MRREERRTARIAASLALCALAAGCATEIREAAFGCPAQISAGETPSARPPPSKFRYVSFFDGDPAEGVNLAPEEGAGTGLDQVWRFDPARARPVTMVCRYHGTELVLEREVPAAISLCRIRGEIDGGGRILGSPALFCE
jgi:hypothetical protein